jgi:alpha-methylacyl-CoA racemase
MAGIRLLSLALNVPGPVAVARLLAHGASATKVEPPSGDPLATYSRAWYDSLHAGVPVVRLDLKSADGRIAFDRLAGAADVLVTSHRPSALARLGLGPTQLAARFPDLRGVAIVGDTAAPEQAGHDVTYQAEAGLVRDRLPLTLLADLVGAERVTATILLALRSAPPVHLQVGLRNVVDDLCGPLDFGLTRDGGLLGGGDPAYGIYATRDGHVAVAALEPHFRKRLYNALQLPVDTDFAEAMAARTSAEGRPLGRRYDVPISPVRPRPRQRER